MHIHTAHGSEFSLDDFSERAGVSPTHTNTILNDLSGPTRLWHVNVHEPGEHNPYGYIELMHPSFNEHTSIVVASSDPDDDDDGPYHVHNPMETDILTHADNVAYETALTIAVQKANSSLNQSPLSSLYSAVDAITNATSPSH